MSKEKTTKKKILKRGLEDFLVEGNEQSNDSKSFDSQNDSDMD